MMSCPKYVLWDSPKNDAKFGRTDTNEEAVCTYIAIEGVCIMTFEENLRRLTAEATDASQREIADAISIKFGSPTHRLIAELGIYARHLETWTCDAEEIGDVRPLRDLLADAAMTLSIQARLASARICGNR